MPNAIPIWGPYPKSQLKSITSQWNSSEAASLTALVPHVQNANNPGIRKGSGLPFARFFWFIFLGCAKKMNNNPITDRKMCSHYLNAA